MFWIAALALLGLYFAVTSYSEGNESLALLWLEIAFVIGAIAFVRSSRHVSHSWY